MKIGIFDSGVGGLTIYFQLKKKLPGINYLYFADQANFPYGEKKPTEITILAARAVEKIIAQNCRLIVIGCNTVTTVSLVELRRRFPQVTFVGVVPPLKTAARLTKTGAIALMATPATCASQYVEELISSWAGDKKVLKIPCRGLVERVEAMDTPGVMKILQELVVPVVVRENVDVVVSGCTHYPLVEKEIKRAILKARFIEPGEAVAVQVKRLIGDKTGVNGKTVWQTTGQREELADYLHKLGFLGG